MQRPLFCVSVTGNFVLSTRRGVSFRVSRSSFHIRPVIEVDRNPPRSVRRKRGDSTWNFDDFRPDILASDAIRSAHSQVKSIPLTPQIPNTRGYGFCMSLPVGHAGTLCAEHDASEAGTTGTTSRQRFRLLLQQVCRPLVENLTSRLPTTRFRATQQTPQEARAR